MAIEYNPNKKTTFNNYIDVAVSNLKKAETETSCVLNLTFPSKTSIGKRFDKKSQINTLKGNIKSVYIALSSIKVEVEKQVLDYLDANRKASMLSIGLTSLYEKQVKKTYKDTNNNWIEIKVGGKSRGYYVDDNGEIVRNKTINGVEFGEDGSAKDYTQYNMMQRARKIDIPDGAEIDSKYIKIHQDVMVLIDDNGSFGNSRSKAGLFMKNEEGEWELLRYEDCIGGRNPSVRNNAGEYVTNGHFNQNENGKFTLEPDSDDPRKETGSFFYATVLFNINSGKWSNMLHTDCFPENINDPHDIKDISEDYLDGTKNKTNGCTRLPVSFAEYIYDNLDTGLYVQIYENKPFEDYDTVAQNDAIKAWADEIENSKSKEETKKIKSEIIDNYGYDVYDLVVKEEEKRKIEVASQLAAADRTESNKTKSKN